MLQALTSVGQWHRQWGVPGDVSNADDEEQVLCGVEVRVPRCKLLHSLGSLHREAWVRLPTFWGRLQVPVGRLASLNFYLASIPLHSAVVMSHVGTLMQNFSQITRNFQYPDFTAYFIFQSVFYVYS